MDGILHTEAETQVVVSFFQSYNQQLTEAFSKDSIIVLKKLGSYEHPVNN